MLLRKPFIERHAIRDEKSTKAETRSGAADTSRAGTIPKAPAPSAAAENVLLAISPLAGFTLSEGRRMNPLIRALHAALRSTSAHNQACRALQVGRSPCQPISAMLPRSHRDE